MFSPIRICKLSPLQKKLIASNTTFSALPKSYLLKAFNKFKNLGRPENFMQILV
jgi:hypothetical protein